MANCQAIHVLRDMAECLCLYIDRPQGKHGKRTFISKYITTLLVIIQQMFVAEQFHLCKFGFLGYILFVLSNLNYMLIEFRIIIICGELF